MGLPIRRSCRRGTRLWGPSRAAFGDRRGATRGRVTRRGGAPSGPTRRARPAPTPCPGPGPAGAGVPHAGAVGCGGPHPSARGEGVVGCDETGVPTPGKASVGGERQDAGTLGQGGPGPMAVTCGDREPQATWPVAVRWSRPTTGASAPQRRQQTRGPEAIPWRTTPARALRRLEQARAWGVPPRGVGADADEGDHPHLLAGVEARQDPAGVAVRTDVAGRRRQAATSRRWRAEAWLQSVPRWQWRTMRWRQGTTGRWRQQCVAVRCGCVPREGSHPEGWLGGERATRGPPEERTSCWSHLPAETTRAERASWAHRRQASEPGHAAATGALGWDPSQGRWGPGLHRPAVPVRRADSVRGWREPRPRPRHTRPGRPRDPVPPSADVPAPDAAGGAS